MTTPALPLAVRLHFVPTMPTPDNPDLRGLFVEARDTRTGTLAMCLGVREMAAWLSARGFRYVTGTQALWSRAEERNVLAFPYGPAGLS